MGDQAGLINNPTLLLRLVLAAVIGGVLGYERRQRGQPAAIGIKASAFWPARSFSKAARMSKGSRRPQRSG